jgi:decaprenylphospho-beta-D-erythro-pentofuranosid-2-ulose 2-reductase
MRRVLIIGATSAIAQATARLFAADGDAFFLVARDDEKVRAVADDLRARGAVQATTMIMDINDFDRHEAMIQEAFQCLEAIDTVLIAHGTLSNQKDSEASFQAARREFETNALSVISLLTHLGNRLERQGHGTLSVISSVAGDRGRQSNYVYGTAKAAVTIFMQGLRNRLHRSGVQVLTIKPGLVDTPMTAGLRKGVLWAKPEAVAVGIYEAIRKKRDVVYLPKFWQLIMWLLRVIPEPIFKRLRL